MSVTLTNFLPRRREISAATNATRATFTTTEDHGYEVGQFLSIHIPKEYGMAVQGVQTVVKSLPTLDSFETDLDTSQLGVYSTPSTPPSFTQSHVVPISGSFTNNTSITG